MGKKSKLRTVIEDTEKEIENLNDQIALLDRMLVKLKLADGNGNEKDN